MSEKVELGQGLQAVRDNRGIRIKQHKDWEDSDEIYISEEQWTKLTGTFIAAPPPLPPQEFEP